ncbi:MAG: response regulator transcription factor [Nitrospirota bacterium]|nr:response regulator transcription factor [Nitrospirota bacterium]
MVTKPQGKSQTKITKILIVDDHPIFRKGLTQLINQETNFTVCGEAEDTHKALEAISEQKPDLIIVDISLKGIDGIELIKKIKLKYSNLSVLVVSMHDESFFAERALRAGARGYIMKQEAVEKMMEAICKVLNGEIYVSEKIGSKLLEKFIDGKPDKMYSPLEALSDRELEVFQLIGQGLETRQVAKELHVSIKTVESYRAHIKEKLKIKTSTELLRYAIRWIESGIIK